MTTTKHPKGLALTARQIIRKEYGNSTNFITPYVVKYGKISRTVAYELSRGTGPLSQHMLYGVSIAVWDEDTNTTRRAIQTSKLFDLLWDAEQYIEKLRAHVRSGGEIE